MSSLAMRAGLVAGMALLLAAPLVHAQRVEPVAFRATSRLEAVPPALLGDSVTSAPRFRGERIVFGAFIGAVIAAPIGAVLAQGACEGVGCSLWEEGLAGGAAFGAVLGALFGLILALPPRGE